MEIRNIRHTGIVVSNLKRSLFFYHNLLGFKIKKRMIEKGKATDRLSNLKKVNLETIKMHIGKTNGMIELLHFRSHKRINKDIKYNISRIGISHFALTVNDLDKLYRNLKRNKIKFVCKPMYSNDKSVKLTFCRAPEGTLIEMVQELK